MWSLCTWQVSGKFNGEIFKGNVKEILSIYDEFVMGLSKEQFKDILKYVYKDPYDFLFMNFDSPWDEVYHRNFNKLVLNAS